MRKSREIFGQNNEAYPEEEKQEMEKRAQVFFSQFETPELKEFLEKINFDILEDIFRRHVVGAGLDPKEVNLLRPDRISSRMPGIPINRGEYVASKNIIGVRLEDTEEEFPQNPDLARAHLLFHEESHATQKSDCHISERYLDEYFVGRNHEKIEIASFQTGYRQRDNNNDLFFYLNEGVTEKLAREVLLEYSEKTGLATDKELNAYKEKIANRKAEHSYDIAVEFVELIIEKLSYSTGFKKSLVWKALVRGAYEGESFNDPELRELIVEEFGDDFLEKLSKADVSDLKKMRNELKEELEQIITKRDKKTIKWLKKLLPNWEKIA